MPKAVSHTPRNGKDFQDLLHLLRENDESVTGIDMSEYEAEGQDDVDGKDTAKSLGEALAEHASCTYLQVDLLKLLSSSIPLSHDDVALMTQSFAPLLQYIRSSESLHHVSLCTITDIFGRPDDPVVESLLSQLARAIAENSGIDILECAVLGNYISLPVNALSTTSSSLRELCLVVVNESLCSDQEKATLAHAILGKKETLEDLTLVSDSSGDVTICVLQELQGRCRNLCRLTLSVKQPPSIEHIQALEQFIQTDTATTASLQFLYLRGYRFQLAGSGNLFAALFNSATDVTLVKCKFNVEATDKFVQAMQQAKNCVSPTGTRFLNVYRDVEFENKSPGTVLAAGLAGSWLSGLRVSQSLSNARRYDGAAIPLTDLFDGMAVNHRNIRLSCLLLDTLCATGAEALARFLPLSSTLSTLRIGTLEDGVNQRQLFHAIRQNGSLLSVKIEALTSSSVYGPRLARILQRNLALPLLATTKGMLPFFPATFWAAQEAPRMEPNNVLIGLAVADDKAVGPSPRQGRGVRGDREE